MALPSYLAKIKSSGIYRFVWDKSEIAGVPAEILRLVVGYSEKGPFNTPVYVTSDTDFKTIFGDISRKMEKRGVWFHRMALQALSSGPIIALNLKKFANETVDACSFNVSEQTLTTKDIPVESIYDTTRFWKLDPEAINVATGNDVKYISLTSTDSKETSCSVFIRGYKPTGYDVTIKNWYSSLGEEVPDYFVNETKDYSSLLVSDFFAEVYVFRGEFTPALCATEPLNKYFDIVDGKPQLKEFILNAFGDKIDTLSALASDEASNFINNYSGCLLPFFKSQQNSYLSLDLVFNTDNDLHKMMMHLNSDLLYNGDKEVIDITTTGWTSAYAFGTELKYTEEVYDAGEYADVVGHEATVYAPDFIEYDGGDMLVTMTGATGSETRHYAYTPEDVQGATGTTEDETYLRYVLVEQGGTGEQGATGEQGGTGEFQSALYMKDGVAYTKSGSETPVYTKWTDGTIDYELDFVSVGLVEGDRVKKTFDGNKLYTITKLETYRITIADFEGNEEVIYNYETIVKCNHSASITNYNLRPTYFEGYVYASSAPASSADWDKLQWQKFILSTLVDYQGIRTGLTNRVDLDYRYIVDTFEAYVDAEVHKELSLICKEKDNAVALLNFPAASTFKKCTYTSFTDDKGRFQVKYIAEGGNKKKNPGVLFSLASETNGASFASYNTPTLFSDGTVKNFVPAAALVSNNFMEKYTSRQPYYVVAGPTYGRLIYPGLVGPDFNYSRADLDILEPMGVNVTVYIPRLGTFINSNQTAKQNPVTALSKLNIRELVIYLQDEIEALLQDYQWEFNTPYLRDLIKAKADTICERIKNNGGIQEYLNVCDESNNTNEVLDNEMFVLSTSIEPGRACGKMVQELTIYRSGQLRALITQQ